MLNKIRINQSDNASVDETTGFLREDAEISVHSEDIREIMARVPSWVLRWGITVFFFVLVMMLAISAFIHYPNIVKTNLKIQSIGVSKVVITPVSGLVNKLLVKQGDKVKKNQPLAVIRNADVPEQFFTLYAPQDGTVAFTSIVQQDCFLTAKQEVFVVYPNDGQVFGIVEIPAGQIFKIKKGQAVLITLKEYSVEQKVPLKGMISYIADAPINGRFVAKVTFVNYTDQKKAIKLKSWMNASADIITQDITILDRILNNIKIKDR